MERQIGEIFEYNDEWYQCVESDSCGECSLFTTECGSGTKSDLADKIFGQCSRVRRSDNKHAIFKKLEKVGESHFIKDEIFEGGKVHVQNFKVYKDFEGHKPICNDYILYDWKNRIISIEIKQNKEDMKMKKVFMNGDDRDYLLDRLEDILHDNHCLEYKDEICNSLCKYITSNNRELKPFSLEAAKAGKPVCTRDGRKARIICFDKRGGSPIIALVETFVVEYDCIREETYYYTIDGRKIGQNAESKDDLMMQGTR